jgi:Fe-S-cluster containining protein
VFRLIRLLFGGVQLPRDQVTKVPRAVKKAAKSHIEGMQAALDELAGMPGIADVETTKQLPKGFYATVQRLIEHYDAYVKLAREHLGLQDTPRAGEPGGCGSCYEAPFGVTGIELLNIYRQTRPRREFPQMAKSMGELGEVLFKEIQDRHKGKDPQKMRMGGKAVQGGRLAFAKTHQACPFLDVTKEKCKIWDHRPMVCRMHHVVGDTAIADPSHAQYPKGAKAKNLRLPVRQQASIAQLDKRMDLKMAPFMYAGILQLLQLSDGELIQELGEPKLRLGQDGRMQGKANRNRRGSKKSQRKRKRKRN